MEMTAWSAVPQKSGPGQTEYGQCRQESTSDRGGTSAGGTTEVIPEKSCRRERRVAAREMGTEKAGAGNPVPA